MGFWDPVLDYQFETQDIATFATLILLEGILSFDNAAVLAAMVRKLPHPQQRRALLYGLVGAYAFRLLAIMLAAFLIKNAILKIVGGLYLLYLAFDHLVRHASGQDDRSVNRVFGLNPFWSTVVMVELADIVFALDQIVAAVALTDKLPVIIAAAFFAILALRLSAVYMIRIMNWFPTLEHLAYVAVGWVGVKLLLEEVTELLHGAGYLAEEYVVHVSKGIAVGVTLVILVVPIIFKALIDTVRRTRLRQAAAQTPKAPPETPPEPSRPDPPEQTH